MSQQGMRLTQPGDVLLAAIPKNVPPGMEQQGTRPVVVVANPASTGPQRFPIIVVVPLTTATGDWVHQNPTLYPQLEAGQGGLRRSSTVLIDQVQALDVNRMLKFYGTLDEAKYQQVQLGLEQMMKLT